jgi:hypothetical protein
LCKRVLVAKPIAVFLGPSLPRAEAESLLDADYFPPARHGDVYRVLTSGVRVITLVDGVFHSTPSVWQRELLAAIDEGVRVVGASSMGALRAAELYELGMIGCGTVFEWYRDGVIEADDEVALLHASEELGFRALSEPLVNIRATVAAAVGAGLLTASQAAALVTHARGRHFPDRSYGMLWDADAFRSLPKAKQEALRAYVRENAVDIKANDARAVLAVARDLLESDPVVPRERADRSIWDPSRIFGAGMYGAGDVVTVGEMVARAKARPELWAPRLAPGASDPLDTVYAELKARFLTLDHARSRGLVAPREDLVPLARAFEQRWGVEPSPEHLAASGLTQRTYTEELEERALAGWLIARHGDGDVAPLVAAWAADRCVSVPGATPETLAAAVISRGPSHFGYDWNLDAAFARELQITGLAAHVARSEPS